MERTEPTLVPEWLKNAGGGSISHSDDHAASRLDRNKPFVNSNGHDFGRSSSSERTTSSYFRRSSSSNGSSNNLRPYSSFGRHNRDRDWEKDIYDSRGKDKSFLGDHRLLDPLGNTFSSKFERDGLRRSQSMVSGKRGEIWPRKVVNDSINTGVNSKDTGLLSIGSRVGGVVKKASFERDFPSLGAEERAVGPDVGRVPSPVLSSAIQSLPIGASATIGGEKWTSALAEVPVLVGSNETAISSVQQVGSLNMAEAITQGPIRAQTAPQLSSGTPRFEELAIKQSRQLIPVTPSMPKALTPIQSLSSLDKQKSRVGPPQHPVSSSSLPVNHSPRGGPAKGDVSKPSNVGKLQFLKPVNGATPVVKENLSPKSVGPPNNVIPERKPISTMLEKRPSSQAQSRNDFFNSVRKKSIPDNTSSVADPAVAHSSESPSFSNVLVPSTPRCNVGPPSSVRSLGGDHLSEERGDLTCNGDVNEKKHSGFVPIISEEEEIAFLRSLGWEENDDEGGLTEEEISGFYRNVAKYINSKPTIKIPNGVQRKFSGAFNSQIEGISGISSGLSSSDAKLES